MQAAERSDTDAAPWQDALFQCLKDAEIAQVAYVPDAGHAHVIRRAEADPGMKAYPLTTEEEGVASLCGVGNCINMLSLIGNCRFPFATIVTMRGESGEFNPWQVPMGRATPAAFELMGVTVHRVTRAEEVGTTVEAALHDAFLGEQAVAVLLSQSLIGRKKWTK